MKRWMKYIRPYLPYFIIGPLCMIVEVIGEVVMPKLLSVVINRANAGVLTVGNSLWIMVAMVVTALLMMAGGVGGAYFGAVYAIDGFIRNIREQMRTESPLGLIGTGGMSSVLADCRNKFTVIPELTLKGAAALYFHNRQ